MLNSPTPVNEMTLLLNRFLGTDLSMSPDRCFLSPADHELMLLTEVPDADSGSSP